MLPSPADHLAGCLVAAVAGAGKRLDRFFIYDVTYEELALKRLQLLQSALYLAPELAGNQVGLQAEWQRLRAQSLWPQGLYGLADGGLTVETPRLPLQEVSGKVARAGGKIGFGPLSMSSAAVVALNLAMHGGMPARRPCRLPTSSKMRSVCRSRLPGMRPGSTARGMWCVIALPPTTVKTAESMPPVGGVEQHPVAGHARSGSGTLVDPHRTLHAQ